jgi:hypothetical protein
MKRLMKILTTGSHYVTCNGSHSAAVFVAAVHYSYTHTHYSLEHVKHTTGIIYSSMTTTTYQPKGLLEVGWKRKPPSHP